MAGKLAVLAILIGALFRSCHVSEPDPVSEREWTSCPIPCAWDGGKVTFLRQHIHPGFMAEYDRQICLEIPGKASVYCWLPTNVGGRTMINVHWMDANGIFGPMLLLQDRWGDYAVDLRRRRTLVVFKSKPLTVLPALSSDPNHVERIKSINSQIKPNGVYAGEIKNKNQGGGISYMTNASGKLVNIRVTGDTTIDLTPYKIYENSHYIGRIDGRKSPLRFIPSSESEAEAINRIK